MRVFKSNPFLLLVFGILLFTGVWVWDSVTVHRSLFTILVAYSLVIMEASLWNTIINKHSLLKQSTYFPLFFFLLLSCCRPSLINLYPALGASFFLTLSLNRLMVSYKKESALSELFDTGLFTGIAILFYLPCISFIIFLCAGILTLRTLNWRECTVSIIGLLLPFLFIYTYLVVSHKSFVVSQFSLTIYNLRPTTYDLRLLIYDLRLMIITFAILITSLFSLWFFINRVQENIVKTQKAWALMIWFCVSSVTAFILSPVKDARALSILIIPGSFILSVYFLKTKSKLLPEILFISLLISLGISNFL